MTTRVRSSARPRPIKGRRTRGPAQHTAAHNTSGLERATRGRVSWTRDRLLRVVDESWTGRRRVCHQHLAAEGTRKIRSAENFLRDHHDFFVVTNITTTEIRSGSCLSGGDRSALYVPTEIVLKRDVRWRD